MREMIRRRVGHPSLYIGFNVLILGIGENGDAFERTESADDHHEEILKYLLRRPEENDLFTDVVKGLEMENTPLKLPLMLFYGFFLIVGAYDVIPRLTLSLP